MYSPTPSTPTHASTWFDRWARPAPDGGGLMYGWQRDMTPEQREHDRLATYETALVDIVHRLAAGTITSAQVRNLMRGVMLRVDRDWDPTDYVALMQQASQN